MSSTGTDDSSSKFAGLSKSEAKSTQVQIPSCGVRCFVSIKVIAMEIKLFSLWQLCMKEALKLTFI